jgi:ribosomal protein S18 acetylase RimI-like enzyme
MQSKIRKATLRDFKKIQELNHKLFVHDYEFDPELLVNAPFTKRNETYYKKAITNDKYLCLVAVDGKKIIGYLIGTGLKKWPSRPIKTGEIENMLVLKKYRGKKIGKALVGRFIK